jgi:hypothetical protein
VLPEPLLDYVQDGLRHRKWIFPAMHTPHGGYDAERHYFSVGDAPYAVSFTVHTGRYTREDYSIPPSASYVSWHIEDEGDGGCLCLSGAPCRNDGYGLAADVWYQKQRRGPDHLVPDELIFAYLRSEYPLHKNGE